MKYYWELSIKELHWVYLQTRLAIENGKIQVKGCEQVGCNVAKGIGVVCHHNNYDDPLDVTWLCRKHHRLEHARINKDRVKTATKIADCQVKREDKKPIIKIWPDGYKDVKTHKFMAHILAICDCSDCEAKRVLAGVTKFTG